MLDRSVERVDGFDGQLQVEVLCTIGLLIRTDDAVRVSASNRRRNRGKCFLVTNELYASIQQGRRDLYPERVQ